MKYQVEILKYLNNEGLGKNSKIHKHRLEYSAKFYLVLSNESSSAGERNTLAKVFY